MSEYTSTIDGFQRAMKWSLTGPPEEARAYANATSQPGFYHIMNQQRLDYTTYVKGLEEWRGKVSDYEPKVEQFLRNGDQLAARMAGTIKVDGAETAFESFMFGKVHPETGKLEHLIKRSVWGPIDKEPEHGVS